MQLTVGVFVDGLLTELDAVDFNVFILQSASGSLIRDHNFLILGEPPKTIFEPPSHLYLPRLLIPTLSFLSIDPNSDLSFLTRL